jgi:DNA-binding response OmpR family regulator
LLDVYDGHEICKEIKNAVELKYFPIIIISATETKESIAVGPCKADDFLVKPFEVKDFIQIIKQQLNTS